jgi:general secretion pathway protein A
MYCDYYGFKEKPFTVTPNPRFVFLSKNHKEAFAHLLYGIDNHAGFIVLTGEVGTGKTTVLRTLLGQLDNTTVRSALILNPCLSAPELLRNINREFGIAWEGLNSPELLDALNHFLLAENMSGHTVVLVIDEAQNLETQVLEQIRLISNLETETSKLIQIILAGQPELAKLLRKPELRQFGQRITVRYHLTPMDFDDTKAYIEHRLEVAGGWRAATFNRDAMRKVFRYSGGIPRLVNITSDRALLIGYIDESREISGKMVARAITEVRENRSLTGISNSRIIWGMGLITVLAVAGIIYVVQYETRVKSPLPHQMVAETAKTLPANKDVSGTSLIIQKGLERTKGSDSTVAAFNALAKIWNLFPVPRQTVVNSSRDLERLAGERDLSLATFTGSLDQLLRVDSPALLEITLPGMKGMSYLALVARRNDRLLIAPPLHGIASLNASDLEKYWSGRAYLPWKNFRNIPRLAPGMHGEGVTRLQQLLLENGLYRGGVTGNYGRETTAAIMAFQASHDITKNGRTGKQTLFFLYHTASGFSTPRLGKKGGEQPG